MKPEGLRDPVLASEQCWDPEPFLSSNCNAPSKPSSTPQCWGLLSGFWANKVNLAVICLESHPKAPAGKQDISFPDRDGSKTLQEAVARCGGLSQPIGVYCRRAEFS